MEVCREQLPRCGISCGLSDRTFGCESNFILHVISLKELACSLRIVNTCRNTILVQSYYYVGNWLGK